MSGPFADLLPPPLPGRFSASFIGATTQCMLRARFDREVNVGGYFATLGRAAHEVFATCELRSQFAGLSQIDPDEAEAIARRVLTNPEESAPLTFHMHKLVIQMARTWAEKVILPTDADTWVIEHPFRLPLYDEKRDVTYTISGRMDEYAIWGTHYRNRDWKTGPKLPSKAEVEEEHTQLPIYAWAAKRENPWLETFELEEFYTRRGIPRTVNMDVTDIDEIESWLLGRCRMIVDAWKNNDFPPNPAERWCAYCPMPDRCPVPESVRLASIIETEEDARATIDAWIVEEARVKQRKGAYRGWLEGGEFEFLVHAGKQYGFIPKKQRSVDNDRLNEALALLGHTKDDFMLEEDGTEFGSRNA